MMMKIVDESDFRNFWLLLMALIDFGPILMFILLTIIFLGSHQNMFEIIVGCIYLDLVIGNCFFWIHFIYTWRRKRPNLVLESNRLLFICTHIYELVFICIFPSVLGIYLIVDGRYIIGTITMIIPITITFIFMWVIYTDEKWQQKQKEQWKKIKWI